MSINSPDVCLAPCDNHDRASDLLTASRIQRYSESSSHELKRCYWYLDARQFEPAFMTSYAHYMILPHQCNS